MSDPHDRVEQLRRDIERRRQAEQLQDRQDRLARQRERDREWRKRPAKSKAASIGLFIVFGSLALILFSGGRSNTGNTGTEINAASQEAPADDVAYSDNAESTESLDEAANIVPDSNQPAEATTVIPELQQEPLQLPAMDDEVTSEQEKAAVTAFNSGQAERWTNGEDAGYAVPSEIVAGCRNITISNDADGALSRVVKLCS